MKELIDVAHIREKVETCIRAVVEEEIPPVYQGMKAMVDYHMGWSGPGAGAEAQGKRIRPLIVVLAAITAGGEMLAAIPAAAAVELLHNFSLIHDDIQDNSPLRRGRETVWKIWGVPQAINTGDLTFTLAYKALHRLKNHLPAAAVLEAEQLFQDTCVLLTGGQHLDMGYETRSEIGLDDYWPMISGKTAALLACSAALGALTAGFAREERQSFYDYGWNLGLAFQVEDDYLGLWGDSALTGKSVESDLVTAKKTLPVLFGLQNNRAFARRWRQGPISVEEAPQIARLLADEGGQEFTRAQAEKYTQKALAALASGAKNEAGHLALEKLTRQLLVRES